MCQHPMTIEFDGQEYCITCGEEPAVEEARQAILDIEQDRVHELVDSYPSMDDDSADELPIETEEWDHPGGYDINQYC